MTKEVKDIVKQQLKSAVKNSLQATGSAVGRVIGNSVGAPQTGASLGKALGSRISRLIGSGDYAVGDMPRHNSLIKGNVPQNITFGSRGVRIAHREYIGDILTGSTVGAFVNNRFTINASDPTAFPYLSNIASLFEKYKFHGLVFETISTCSPYLSTSSMGSIVAACQFNNHAGIFTSKTQMENCEDAVSCRLDKNLLYGVECEDQVQNFYYTRQIGASPAAQTESANIYDLGIFQVATVGGSVSASTTVAELWVTYDVELCGPRLPSVRPSLLHAHASTSVAGSTPLGTNGHFRAYGTLGTTTITPTTISFNNSNAGDAYIITVYWYNCTAFTAPSLTYTNCSAYNLLSNHSQSVIQSQYTTGTLAAAMSICLVIDSPRASLAFGTGGTLTGASACEFVITPIDFSLPASSI